MPRGQRKTDEDRLKDFDAQIAEMIQKRDAIQSKIDELKTQKQELLDEIQNKKLAEIAKILQETGKTPEEVIAMLKNS